MGGRLTLGLSVLVGVWGPPGSLKSALFCWGSRPAAIGGSFLALHSEVTPGRPGEQHAKPKPSPSAVSPALIHAKNCKGKEASGLSGRDSVAPSLAALPCQAQERGWHPRWQPASQALGQSSPAVVFIFIFSRLSELYVFVSDTCLAPWKCFWFGAGGGCGQKGKAWKYYAARSR